jgi:hypothetical protein
VHARALSGAATGSPDPPVPGGEASVSDLAVAERVRRHFMAAIVGIVSAVRVVGVNEYAA